LWGPLSEVDKKKAKTFFGKNKRVTTHANESTRGKDRGEKKKKKKRKTKPRKYNFPKHQTTIKKGGGRTPTRGEIHIGKKKKKKMGGKGTTNWKTCKKNCQVQDTKKKQREER